MSNPHTFFSIIIPTFNRSEKLRRALESIERQTFRDFEVIVCDDGSTDSTGGVVDSFRGRMDLKYSWEENWGGPARPRNNGLKIARGEWICFLDSDDWWYPKKLEAVRAVTDNADVVYHDLDFVTPKGKKNLRLRSRQLTTPVFVCMLTRENYLANSSFCVRKEILDLVGPLSEEKELISVEDFDLWIRLSLATERFLYIPKMLGAYWTGEGNISINSDVQIQKKTYLFGKYTARLGDADRRQSDLLLRYHIGLNRMHIGMYRESLECFREALWSRDFRVRMISFIYLLISGYKNIGARFCSP